MKPGRGQRLGQVRGWARLSLRRRRGAPSKPNRGAAWRRRAAAAMGRGKGQRGVQERHSWPGVAVAMAQRAAAVLAPLALLLCSVVQKQRREREEEERERRERREVNVFDS